MNRSIYRQKADELRAEGPRLYAEHKPSQGRVLVRAAKPWERTARRIEWLYGDVEAREAA